MTTSAAPVFDAPWTEIRAELRRFVRRRVRDEHTADDLTQEVLVRLANESASHGRPYNLAAWIFHAANNVVIDHYRRHKNHVELPETLADPRPVNEGDPELARLHAAFRAFVHSLPPIYREALLLTEYEGLTQKEAAERLGVAVSTAKSRVQRARDKLFAALTACCTFELDARGQVLDWRRKPDAGDCPQCSSPSASC